MGLSALIGVLQYVTALMIVDDSPVFDLLERSKAAKADEVVVQAAIADARRLDGAVDITHLRRMRLCAAVNSRPCGWHGASGERVVCRQY
jgi:hypothetical protein